MVSMANAPTTLVTALAANDKCARNKQAWPLNACERSDSSPALPPMAWSEHRLRSWLQRRDYYCDELARALHTLNITDGYVAATTFTAAIVATVAVAIFIDRIFTMHVR